MNFYEESWEQGKAECQVQSGFDVTLMGEQDRLNLNEESKESKKERRQNREGERE